MSKDDDELEDKFINEQYKNWKVNSPYLYDVVMSHALEWPSLTVQWLPDEAAGEDGERKSSDGPQERQLLVGTHTSADEQNYLLVVKVIMPSEDDVEALAKEDEDEEEKAQRARVKIVKRINHDGEVNRARYMPQRPTIVATKAPAADVYVFDCTTQPAKPDTDGKCKPDMKLCGHDKEGYGLSWNSMVAGRLVSGSDDSTICVWDIDAQHANKDAVDPLCVYKGHSSVVEDVAWHVMKKNIFGSVGDDKQLLIWDELVADKKPVQSVAGHSSEINCLAFNPFNEHLLATGSADKTVAIWDMRNMAAKLHAFDSHEDEIIQVQWNPVYQTILGSCSQDRKVSILDLSRIGEEQSKDDAEEGPPELLFQHGGHTSKVSDFCWSTHDPWMVCSVAEDNILQVWKMASHIYQEDDEGGDVPMKDLE
eukprot:CAMPEP_0181341408 /NCGR_PEP_ID=MMETSP1101-20121128/30396_1 /TAXON_ID=46948 /ORGANISM="Rhodomonas abbreviata, Strain Caron Lab Isolate" /LENGTH=422 /DNA_ID=CAMNT_0023452687 /DNA_START=22 /DNA_END=1290 /DNA_ORIENTATION=+